MKSFVTIELEVPFSEDETKMVDDFIKKNGETFRYYMSRAIEEMLVYDANISLENIKSIEINRVD